MDKNTELLGKFKNNFYSISRKVKPSFQNIKHFSVTIHYTDERNEEVEIVRIDNSHGYVHIDKLFEEGEPKEEMKELDAFTAYEFLKKNWRDYAKKYERKKK